MILKLSSLLDAQVAFSINVLVEKQCFEIIVLLKIDGILTAQEKFAEKL